jgi:hypothetical protein
MTRTVYETLRDTTRWFDPAAAEEWGEGTRWDGRNHISLATGDQWIHEILYRTAGGTWVLHRYSQWQGTRDSYREISAEDAATWLVRNEREPPEDLAPAVAAIEADAPAPAKRKMVAYRLDEETRALIERAAKAHECDQTSALCLLVRAGSGALKI